MRERGGGVDIDSGLRPNVYGRFAPLSSLNADINNTTSTTGVFGLLPALSKPNGLALSADERTLYLGESTFKNARQVCVCMMMCG